MEVRVAVVQTDPVFGEKEKNLKAAVNQMTAVEADLYVLPELFASGYNFENLDEVRGMAESFENGPTIRGLEEFVKKQKAFVAFGFAERDGTALYNSAGLLGHDGTKGVYRKIHLFDRERLFFSPGNLPFSVWTTPFGRIGMMVCFDWYFPESARTLALRGAQLIAHPSNLVMSHCPEAMKIRCLENRVYAATANRIGSEERGGRSLTYIGKSQITSPGGEVLHRSPADKAGVGVVMIDPEKGTGKALNANNDLLGDRRPEFYA